MQLTLAPPFAELQNYKTIQLTLLLFWLTLTGGYRGWDVPALVIINFLLWGALMAWGIFHAAEIFMHPLAFPLVMLGVANLASVLQNETWNGLTTVVQWTGYGVALLWFRRWQIEEIQQVASWLWPFHVALAYTPLLFGGWWNNMNVIAALIVGLYLLSLKSFHYKSYDILWLVIIFVTVGWWLESVGGVIALSVGVVIVLMKEFDLAIIPLSGLLVSAGYLISPASYLWRLTFWAESVRLFTLRPYLGIGSNQFKVVSGGASYLHAHNVIFTTLAETGLVGFVPLAMFLRRVVMANLSSWSRAVVLPLLIWSLIDEPLRFWGVGAIFILALSQAENQPGVQQL